MATLFGEINRIISVKEQIRQAIGTKGVTVNSNALVGKYAEHILLINTDNPGDGVAGITVAEGDLLSQISRISLAKEDMRLAIIEQGVAVGDDELIDVYPERILAIKEDTGGGGGDDDDDDDDDDDNNNDIPVDVPTTDTVTAYYVWATSTGDTVYTTSLNPSAGKFLWSSKNNTVYIEAGQTPNQAYAKHAYGTVSSATKKSYVYMGDYSSSTRYWRDESKDEIKIGTTVKRGSRLYGEYEGEHSFKTRVFLSTLTGENIFTSNEDRPTVVPVLYKQTEAMSEDGVATVAGRNIEISYDVVYKINGVYFIRNGHEFLNGSKTYYIRETYNVWDSELQKDVQLNADEYIEYGGWEKRARESGVGFNLDTGLYTEGDSCKIYILFAPIVKHDNVVYSCDDSKYVAASYSFLEQCNIQAWTTAPCYSAETMYTSSTDNHSHLYQTTADAADGKDGLSYRINTGTYSITSASGTTYYFKNI